MQPRPPGIPEFLVLALVGVGVVLLLAMTVGKIVSLLWAAAVPLAAWLYARRRVPRHTLAIVGFACGLAAYPVSRGIFALIMLPMPFQLIGLIGLVGELMHGFPGTLVALYFQLERQADTSVDTILVDYLFNGLAWAVVYGYLGSVLDRTRHARPPYPRR